MNEVCLTLEEQLMLVKLITSNTESAAKFMEKINADNVTEHDQEVIALMTQCYEASKKLGGLINKIKHNVERYENG